MFPYEGVIHYVTVVRLQDLLELCDVIILVGTVMKHINSLIVCQLIVKVAISAT